MYGIVWYYNKEIGKKQLKKIAKEYLDNKINYNRIIQFPTSIIFENGDTWKLLPANDCSRGHKCNISFIERCISIEKFNIFIRPATIGEPYRAYNFYGEGDLDIWNINF